MANANHTSSEWVDPDDAPPLDADWFERADHYRGGVLIRRGRPRAESPKKPVSLRLDTDVIDWFRASGDGWQSRMNSALRKAAGL